MNKYESNDLVETGHEIGFTYKNKKYSITQDKINGKPILSFCEFYKETTEVSTFEELCEVKEKMQRL